MGVILENAFLHSQNQRFIFSRVSSLIADIDMKKIKLELNIFASYDLTHSNKSEIFNVKVYEINKKATINVNHHQFIKFESKYFKQINY